MICHPLALHLSGGTRWGYASLIVYPHSEMILVTRSLGIAKTALPLGGGYYLAGTNESVFLISVAKRVCMKSVYHPQVYLGKCILPRK